MTNPQTRTPSATTSLTWLAFFSLLAFLFLTSSAIAEEQDSTFSGLITMLEAEMSEAVILDWLQTVEEVPPKPSAEDLVTLREAGATDVVLRRYLAMARGEASPKPVVTGPPESSRPAQTTPSQTAPAQPAADRPDSAQEGEGESARSVPTHEAPAPRAVVDHRARELDPPGRGVPVEFRATYLPFAEEDDDEEWNLYLYLNSQLLTFVPTGNHLLRNSPLRFRQNLEPGRYVVRVLQEQHQKRLGGRWEHEARVAREAFVFDLEAGKPAQVSLHFKQPLTAIGRLDQPLSFEFIQGDRIETVKDRGGDPENWPLLCEEIEASIKPGKEPGRAARRALESCLRWADLWQEDPTIEVVPRQAIRDGMATLNYRPMPRNQLGD